MTKVYVVITEDPNCSDSVRVQGGFFEQEAAEQLESDLREDIDDEDVVVSTSEVEVSVPQAICELIEYLQKTGKETANDEVKDVCINVLSYLILSKIPPKC